MKHINLVLSLVTLSAVICIIAYAMSQGVAVLEPQGLISHHQRDMFWLAIILGLSALIPVFIMTSIIVYRYHTSDDKPTSRLHRKWEVRPQASWIWAAFVVLIITTLAVFMYKSTFKVDPYKPLASSENSMTVQVVALPWKWLFIYPEDNIASVNELVIPVNKPISFELTADAPMSSFWIPKLGGMIYAMEGMVTKLHLLASSEGVFEGMNTEINGEGYSGMRFKTKAVSAEAYEQWVIQTRIDNTVLDELTYETLAEPSVNNSVSHFSGVDSQLFSHILAKFMNHSTHEVLGETHQHTR